MFVGELCSVHNRFFWPASVSYAIRLLRSMSLLKTFPKTLYNAEILMRFGATYYFREWIVSCAESAIKK